tara:strand:+ start:121 stop:525 length:405 start_codon:yes stop_codon:yes gene_type:complete
VLAALLYAIIKGFQAGEHKVDDKERCPYLIAMVVAHIQLLLGLGLYFMGENGLTALDSLFDAGASLLSSLGFFGIIHFVLMVTAITVITKAHSLAKKNATHRRVVHLMLLALLIILAAIPWPFYGYGRGFFPGT